jgi:hypothetical protein
VAVAITRAADGEVLYANDRLAAPAGIAAQDAVGGRASRRPAP